MQDQMADVTWREGGVPVSTRFDDPYFSLDNGLEETRHTFLAGNGLPERFRPGFHVAELGFGTGLNLLASLQAWRDSGQTGCLRFTSFEAFPMALPDMARALAAFPELAALAQEVLGALSGSKAEDGGRVVRLRDLEFVLVVGDARVTLPVWEGAADAWYLDGFAPARNPELWSPGLMAAVAARTAPGGTAASYTAAGHVRRALAAAGFDVARRAGFGRKRHMTIARIAEG